MQEVVIHLRRISKQFLSSEAESHSFPPYSFLPHSRLQYRQMSSASATKRNWDTAGDNETLFDFLKRKKKYALESTVNKTLHHHSYTKNKVDLDVDDDFPQFVEHTTHVYPHSHNAPNRTARQQITPKKIEFQERPRSTRSIVKETNTHQPGQTHNAQGKSFLSMISPLKNNRPSSALEQPQSSQKENAAKSSRKSSKGTQSFSKKNVTKSISSIKQAMHSLTTAIRTLRDKSHGLVVHFNPLFNSIDPNAPVAKQVGEFRNRLKAFEATLHSVDADNSDEVLEGFHKNLEEHMQFEQGQLRRGLQRAKEEEVSAFKTEKEQLLAKTQAENRRLAKEVDLLQRRLERAENTHSDLAEAVTEREMNSVQQMDRIKANYQETLQQLKSKNEQLVQRCRQLEGNNSELRKECKTERFGREGLQEASREEMRKIIQAKDAYLLNEIMVMKEEFKAEVTKINDLHMLKEAELLGRVAAKEKELERYVFQRGCDRQIEGKVMEQASILRAENGQLKAKAECIITDMYRMNEELYQHWMALKDVKALATRLGTFAQYRKIYDDVHFNDHLFH